MGLIDRRATKRLSVLAVVALCLAAAMAAAATRPAAAQSSSAGAAWSELNAPQRSALKPLEQDWATIDAQRKQKWLELASRFDRMSPEERERTQQRMTDWVRLSPKERNDARLNFQGARQLTPQERQERWEAYKALPEDTRRQLATQGKINRAPLPLGPRIESKATGPKVNTVSNPFLDVGRPRPVTPGVVQVKPGATTMPITAKAAPPLHQQPGLPKVAATPEFVDSTTLLPQRGAQGAATEPRNKQR